MSVNWILVGKRKGKRGKKTYSSRDDGARAVLNGEGGGLVDGVGDVVDGEGGGAGAERGQGIDDDGIGGGVGVRGRGELRREALGGRHGAVEGGILAVGDGSGGHGRGGGDDGRGRGLGGRGGGNCLDRGLGGDSGGQEGEDGSVTHFGGLWFLSFVKLGESWKRYLVKSWS